MKKPKVFADSSVWFAAVCSPAGGSSFIFSLASRKIELVTTQTVLAEVERNVRQKLEFYHLERFFNLTAKAKLLKGLPNKNLIVRSKKVIVAKDAVILSGSKRAKVGFLITFDKKHFLTDKVKTFMKGTIVCPPGEFIEKHLKFSSP